MWRLLLVSALITLASLLGSVDANANQELIARLKLPVHRCVSIIGSNGWEGCRTGSEGATGFLHMINNQIELDEFTSTPTSPSFWNKLYENKIALVIPINLYTHENIKTIAKTRTDVSMVLVLWASEEERNSIPLVAQSPDEVYPNREWGLYPNSTMKWNSYGTAWVREMTIPLALIPHEYRTVIEKATKRKMGVLFDDSMSPHFDPTEKEVAVERCNRHMHCSPLGARKGSILATMKGKYSSINKTESNPPIDEGAQQDDHKHVVLMAPLDGNSMFHTFTTSAHQMASIASLLAAYSSLIDYEIIRPIHFLLFQGESWGYLGSKKFVMENYGKVCGNSLDCEKVPIKYNAPFQLGQVSAMIQVDSIASINSDKLFIHKDPLYDGEKEERDKISKLFKQNADKFKIGLEETKKESQELPPGSIHSFLKLNRTIPSVLISDFDDKYSNEHYNSILDTKETIDGNKICQFCELIATTLLHLSNDHALDVNVQCDCDLANELFYCLSVNSSCSLIKNYILYSTSTPTNYVGVHIEDSFVTTWLSEFVRNASLVSSSRSDVTCKSSKDCEENGDIRYQRCLGKKCVNDTSRAVVNVYHTVSPGFKIPDHRYKPCEIRRSNEPLYSEPFWNSPDRIVIMDLEERSKYWMTLGLGLGVAISSILVALVVPCRK